VKMLGVVENSGHLFHDGKVVRVELVAGSIHDATPTEACITSAMKRRNRPAPCPTMARTLQLPDDLHTTRIRVCTSCCKLSLEYTSGHVLIKPVFCVPS
jgi:hypothetical protein